MWIGLGIILIVIGALLNWALEVDVPMVTDDVLGWILIAAGVAAVVISFLAQAQRNRRHTTTEVRNVESRDINHH